MVILPAVALVIHTHHNHNVGIFRRRRNQHLPCAGVEMFGRVRAGGEAPGGFYNDVRAQFLPGKPRRVGLG